MAANVSFEIVERLVVLKDRKPAWDLELTLYVGTMVSQSMIFVSGMRITRVVVKV